jgi:hypothetical protein
VEQALRRFRTAPHCRAGDDAIKQVPDVSAVTLIGGQRREIRIVLDEGALAPTTFRPCRWPARWGFRTGACLRAFASGNREYLLETGEFLRTAEDVRNVVAGVATASRSSCAMSPK